MPIEQATAGPNRDQLALERTQLANERTLLAYVRTAIMIVATGATLLKLYPHETSSVVVGSLLVAAGVVVAAIGTARYRARHRQLKNYQAA